MPPVQFLFLPRHFGRTRRIRFYATARFAEMLAGCSLKIVVRNRICALRRKHSLYGTILHVPLCSRAVRPAWTGLFGLRYLPVFLNLLLSIYQAPYRHSD